MNAPAHDVSAVFIELGAAIVGLAILARVARRLGFSAIPLYLLAGLAFGKGGLAPLQLTENFIHLGAEIGVVLLLFMLGLEYTAEQLKENLRTGLSAGVMDLVLNFTPGLLFGLWLKWGLPAAILLGGVTYISSSGVIARVLAELRRLDNPETPSIISVLVLEDLAMAIYLPVVGALLGGRAAQEVLLAVAIAIGTVSLILFLALRYGRHLSRFLASESEEVILLTTFGIVLLVSGLAQTLQVSAAIGAFLVGIALSGPVAEQSRRVVAPLRDLFAATFFFFFGLEVDPSTLPGVMPMAILLGVITVATKTLAGWWAAKRQDVDRKARFRAGMTLIARGEFSIIIAGLGIGLEPRLGPLAAGYVLLMAVAGPLLARLAR